MNPGLVFLGLRRRELAKTYDRSARDIGSGYFSRVFVLIPNKKRRR